MNRRPNNNNRRDVKFKVAEDPHMKNDLIYKLEKKIVNRYSRKAMGIGIILGIVIPPYIMYWKDQQMKVSFFLSLKF